MSAAGAAAPWPDAFDAGVVDGWVARVRGLAPGTAPRWGRMDAAAMLAHLNVAYEMVYDGTHPRPNAVLRWILRRFLKDKVCGPQPYARNTPTAPAFRIAGARDLDRERDRLVAYLRRVQGEGRAAFEGRDSPSFGPLTAGEWSVLFAKHVEHHFAQFGI